MTGINGVVGCDNKVWLPRDPSLSSPPAECHLAMTGGGLQLVLWWSVEALSLF